MDGRDISVCIATIPPRAKMLRQALSSVVIQTLQPGAIIVEYDHEHTGAAATKNRALDKVRTPWTAWLDDDDMFLPNHLEELAAGAEWSKADVIYSWPEMQGNADPTPQWFGRPFDGDALRKNSYVHTTTLFRTMMARSVGGFEATVHEESGMVLDDWGRWVKMLDAGAEFHHVPKRTWVWRVENQNTSGSGDRW
jgi:glycosyltransferase involved in cell wall biosynthesis